MRWLLKHPIWSGLIALFAVGVIGASGSSNNDHNNSHHERMVQQSSDNATDASSSAATTEPAHHRTAKKRKHHAESTAVTDLANLDYHSGEAAYRDVNGGNSTLNPSSWHSVHIDYANLDHWNRTAGATTAYLASENVANDSLRQRQTVYPTGWHQKFINNEAIINRGHLIAYSLSKGIDVEGKYHAGDEAGDQNNMKNLFTQTAFSNQRFQTIYESKIRDALRAGKHVVYQVQPIFREDELMARGVHLQAISTDNALDFNVYLFNVQPGIQFDYQDGTSKVDHAMNVPTPAGAPDFGNQGQTRHYYHHYYPYHHYYHYYPHFHRHYYYHHHYHHHFRHHRW